MGKMIKFDHVNEHGNFEALLTHYGLEYTKKGNQIRLCCPFHEDTNPSLSITLVATEDAKANTWHCFGCRNNGSIIDFAARMDGVSLRDGAITVESVSGCGLAPTSSGRRRKSSGAEKPAGGSKSRSKRSEGHNKEKRRSDLAEEAKSDPGTSEPVSDEELGQEDEVNTGSSKLTQLEYSRAANPPLQFSLELQDHVALYERTSTEMVKAFELGVCPETSRSMMAGRLCIPIHNDQGELICYAGRYLGDDPEAEKYKFPPNFKKMATLFNLHRLEPVEPFSEWDWVVLVEGFFDAIRVHELGVPVVACMGTAVSVEQVRLLYDLGYRKVFVMFDGDPEGQAATKEAVWQLSDLLDVKRITLPDGTDPASCSEKELVWLRGIGQLRAV